MAGQSSGEAASPPQHPGKLISTSAWQVTFRIGITITCDYKCRWTQLPTLVLWSNSILLGVAMAGEGLCVHISGCVLF